MAWPPQPKADKDKAAGPETALASITVATTGTSNAPRTQPKAKQASAIFSKQLIGRKKVRGRVGKPHKVGREGGQSVVRAQKPTPPAAAEMSKTESENL